MAPNLETVFARYEADLLRLSPGRDKGFVCPICMEFIAHSKNLSEKVAIEHIIPSKLGGKSTTLTCRRCNNTAGSKLESHLVQRVQIEGRKKPINAGVEFCDTAFRAAVHLPNSPGDAIKLYGIQEQSDHREIDKFGELLSAGVWDGQDIKLNLEPRYSVIRSAAALVRSAYLLMFRVFGYRYVFDRSAAAIRKAITEPLVETDALKGVSWRVGFRPPTETGVSIITDPEELRSFMIFLTLDRDQDHVSGIVLPPPNIGTEFFRILDNSGSPRTCSFSSLGSGINKEILPFDEVWKYVINNGAVRTAVLEDGNG